LVDGYIEFLIKEGICFISSASDRKNFPELPLFWDYPAIISNSIIDVSRKNLSYIKEIVSIAKILNNTNIQFRFFDDSVNEKSIIELISTIIRRQVTYSEFYIDYRFSALVNDFLLLQERGSCNIVVKIFNSEENKVLMFDKMNVIKAKTKISEVKCGTFVLNENAEHFCESQHYNTCLNRKLCIDKDGYIKNCPYMKHHYGHISNTNIEDVVKLPEFQKWWHIKKDDIDVCMDCEFRHMCTDCRAFIKDPENIYSQPAKCTYNPYICKWEGEEGYVPVEECGTYSRETGFVPDKKKIKKLNKQIWGDE
jgi:SPASM domain peptide maturase of grasp-with-spasm system